MAKKKQKEWEVCLWTRERAHWRLKGGTDWCWARDALGGDDGALFGCHYISIGYRPSYTKDMWYKYGEYRVDGLWHIDKALLTIAISEQVAMKGLEECPEWDWERVYRVIENLPAAIDPEHPDWCSAYAYVEGIRQANSIDYVGDHKKMRRYRLRLVKGEPCPSTDAESDGE